MFQAFKTTKWQKIFNIVQERNKMLNPLTREACLSPLSENDFSVKNLGIYLFGNFFLTFVLMAGNKVLPRGSSRTNLYIWSNFSLNEEECRDSCSPMYTCMFVYCMWSRTMCKTLVTEISLGVERRGGFLFPRCLPIWFPTMYLLLSRFLSSASYNRDIQNVIMN